MYPNDPNQQPPQTPPQPGGNPPVPPQVNQPQQPADPWVLQQPQQPLPPQQPNTPVGGQTENVIPYQEPRPTYAPDGMTSIDYLNQISAHQKKTFQIGKKPLLFIGGALLLVLGLVIAYSISASLGPSSTEKSQQLLAKTTALSEVASESQDNIKASSLSSLNSSLIVQLSGATTEISGALSEFGITEKSTSKAILAAESNTELLEKLEDARLSGYFDRVYTREMTFHLETLLLLMEEISSNTGSENVKTKLESAHGNIAPLLEQMEEIRQTVE